MILRAERSLLIISNVQEDLLWGIGNGGHIIENSCILAALARDLGVPTLVFEHKGLGATQPIVRDITSHVTPVEIATFAYLSNPKTREKILESGRDQLVFLGTEMHISILQSAIEAVLEKSTKLHAFVVAEGSGSRDQVDADTAVRRMQQAGVEIVTREMVMFEWVPTSEHPRYMEWSQKYLKHPTVPFSLKHAVTIGAVQSARKA